MSSLATPTVPASRKPSSSSSILPCRSSQPLRTSLTQPDSCATRLRFLVGAMKIGSTSARGKIAKWGKGTMTP